MERSLIVEPDGRLATVHILDRGTATKTAQNGVQP